MHLRSADALLQLLETTSLAILHLELQLRSVGVGDVVVASL